MTARSGVTAAVIHYEDYDSLPACLESLLAQETAPERVLLIDNSSDTVRREELRAAFPSVELAASPCNRGYAGAANDAIRLSTTPYLFLLNPDVRLEKDFLARLLAVATEDPRIGAAGGKLLRPSGCLDSTGISIRRTRRVCERGQGEPDVGRYAAGDVFAVCGAAVLLRRDMLRDAEVLGQCFDEDFFVYHEDTDLCWRARLLGWRTCYVPDAVAWHRRGWGRDHARKALPISVRLHSFKNHYYEILKNEDPLLLLRDLPFVLGWQAVRLLYVLFFEPALLRAYWQVLRSLPSMLAKRRAVMSRRRCSRAELAPFFSGIF